MAQQATDVDQDWVIVGRFLAAYGIKGWVGVFSHTDPVDNLFEYSPWFVEGPEGWTEVQLEAAKPHGKGLVAKLAGCEQREDAQALTGRHIAIRRHQLPRLEAGEYYWRDLQGLRVVTREGVDLGVVHHLLETGSNDVLVVRGDAGSRDREERLLPYLPGQVVLQVNLAQRQMVVDWDPDF